MPTGRDTCLFSRCLAVPRTIPQDRPDAPLVRRLVLGEVPVPADYDAPAPTDNGLSEPAGSVTAPSVFSGLSERLVNSTRINVRLPSVLPPQPPRPLSSHFIVFRVELSRVGVVCAGGRADAKAVADGGVVVGPRQGR